MFPLAVVEFSVRSSMGVNTGDWMDVSWAVDRQVSLVAGGETVSERWEEYEFIQSNHSVRVVVGARLYTSGRLLDYVRLL